MDVFLWTEEKEMRIIDLWEERESLHNYCDKDYHKRGAKNAALEEMEKILQAALVSKPKIIKKC